MCIYIYHDGCGGHRTTGVSALLPSTHESGNGTSQVVTLSKFPYPLSCPTGPISFLSLLVVTFSRTLSSGTHYAAPTVIL